jgi:hypothetical protein
MGRKIADDDRLETIADEPVEIDEEAPADRE